MLKEKGFQEYRRDYKEYSDIPGKQENIRKVIKDLIEEKNQKRQEAQEEFDTYESGLQKQYNQYVDNSKNPEYIDEEYLKRFPQVEKERTDLEQEINAYNQKYQKDVEEQENLYQGKRKKLVKQQNQVNDEIASLQQKLDNTHVPDVFSEEQFRKQRQDELKNLPRESMLSTNVDLSQKYKEEIDCIVASVMNRSGMQSVLPGPQQGTLPEKINNAMKKPFQPEIFSDVTRNGLAGLIAKVEAPPKKPENIEQKEIRKNQIKVEYPVPKVVNLILKWIIPILIGVFAFHLLKSVNFYVFSYRVLKSLFRIVITIIGLGIGLGIGVLFQRPLTIVIGGIAGGGISFLVSKSLSITWAIAMHEGMASGLKIVLALAVFIVVKIIFSVFIAKPVGNGIARILGKGKEEALREQKYQELIKAQESLQQKYQLEMQQYENKMLQLEELEDQYYNFAHYKEIVTLVLEKERVQKEAEEKKQREITNKERELSNQKKEKEFVEETEVLIEKNRKDNADERVRVQNDIISKKEMLGKQESELEKIASEITLAEEEYENICAAMQEKAEEQEREHNNRRDEVNSKIAECKQKIKDGELDCAEQKKKEIEEAKNRHLSNLESIEQKYGAKVQEKEDDIRKLDERRNTLFDQMEKNLDELESNLVEYEESQGAFSDYLYPYTHNEENPVYVHELKHNKKPIVFLYRQGDSGAVAQSLYNFMTMINMAMLSMNCDEIYESIVSDPVAKASWFGKDQQDGLIRINNDIKSLYSEIDKLRTKVGNTEERNIELHNQNTARKGESYKRCLKYKVVQFLVPEQEAAANTDFFSADLWGTLQASTENGFLPIFYIKEEDWQTALDDESKFNGKFVKFLVNSMGGDMKNVYVADAKKLSIVPYGKGVGNAV